MAFDFGSRALDLEMNHFGRLGQNLLVCHLRRQSAKMHLTLF